MKNLSRSWFFLNIYHNLLIFITVIYIFFNKRSWKITNIRNIGYEEKTIFIHDLVNLCHINLYLDYSLSDNNTITCSQFLQMRHWSSSSLSIFIHMEDNTCLSYPSPNPFYFKFMDFGNKNAFQCSMVSLVTLIVFITIMLF